MEEPSNASDVVPSVDADEDAKACIYELPKPSNAVHSPSNATDVLKHSVVNDYAPVCIDEQPSPSTAVHSSHVSSEKVTFVLTTCEPNSMMEQKAVAHIQNEEENASVAESLKVPEEDAREYEEISKKRKLEEREKEGSLVDGMSVIP